MRLHGTRSTLLVLVFGIGVATIGCGKGDAPALSISSTGDAGATDHGGGVAASAAEQKLFGVWNGTFAMHADAAVADFDAATLTACKSMRIRIEFRDKGAMAMTASMVLPEIGEKTNTSEGRWELLSEADETVTVRSTEDGAEPEDITMIFRGRDTFEMTPPNQLKALGVMRFSREK